MPVYKITVTTHTSGTASITKRGRCVAANVKLALGKLFNAYPAYETANNISIGVQLDDEEEFA